MSNAEFANEIIRLNREIRQAFLALHNAGELTPKENE